MDNSNAPTYLGVGIALPVLAGMMLAVGFILLMFSVGPGAVTVDLTVTVRDRATKRPVAGCEVAFEEIGGSGVTVAETDSKGIARGRVGMSEEGSPISPWNRDVTLGIVFHLGNPRHETWSATVPFRRPWLFSRATADVELATTPWVAPDEWPKPRPAAVSQTDVAISIREENGRTVYAVPLELFLDQAQVGGCTS